jgi:hypothetical protein
LRLLEQRDDAVACDGLLHHRCRSSTSNRNLKCLGSPGFRELCGVFSGIGFYGRNPRHMTSGQPERPTKRRPWARPTALHVACDPSERSVALGLNGSFRVRAVLQVGIACGPIRPPSAKFRNSPSRARAGAAGRRTVSRQGPVSSYTFSASVFATIILKNALLIGRWVLLRVRLVRGRGSIRFRR